jgi:hypothetical protein
MSETEEVRQEIAELIKTVDADLSETSTKFRNNQVAAYGLGTAAPVLGGLGWAFISLKAGVAVAAGLAAAATGIGVLPKVKGHASRGAQLESLKRRLTRLRKRVETGKITPAEALQQLSELDKELGTLPS